MTLTGLKWGSKEQAHVPTVEEMRETAASLLASVESGRCTTASSGGFMAGLDDDCLYLAFQIEEQVIL